MPGDAGKPTLTAPTPHVSRTSWPNAVKHDRLVDMGFEDNEADQFIEKVPKLAFPGSADGTLFRASPPPTVIELSEDITSDFIPLPEEEAAIAVEKTEEGSRVNLTGNVSEETINRLTAVVHSDQLRENVEAEARRHRAIWQNHVSPAQRGVPFLVPQLCFTFDGDLEPAEKETLLDASGWSLLDYSPELTEAEFRLTETGVQWEIDLSVAGKITEKAIGKAEQHDLDLVDTAGRAISCAVGLSARCASRTSRSRFC